MAFTYPPSSDGLHRVKLPQAEMFLPSSLPETFRAKFALNVGLVPGSQKKY